MRFARMVGLAAIAAAVLTATLGAGSAVAEPLTETTLCKSSVSSPYCASSNRYPASTAISASSTSSTSVTIKTQMGNVSCGESTINAGTTAETGSSLPLSVSAWTLGGCKLSGTSCTATAVKSTPYAGALTGTREGGGTLNVSSGGSGNPGWTVECGSAVNCTYTMEPGLAVQSAGSSLSLTASEVSLAKSGFLCGKSAKFSGTYSVSTPSPSYLAVQSTEPVTTLCSALEQYCGHVTTTLEGKTSTLVINNPSNYGGGDLDCTAELSASPKASYGEPLPMGMSLHVYGCESPNGPMKSCNVSASNVEGGISRESGTVDGQWTSLYAEFYVNCGQYIQCTYKLANNEGEAGTILHGNPGAIDWNDEPMTVSGSICPASPATLEGADFTLHGGPLYVTDALH